MPDGRSLALRTIKTVAAVGDRVRPPATGVVVLIYHRVGGGSGTEVDLSPEAFDAQMAWLAASRRVVSLDAAVDLLDPPAGRSTGSDSSADPGRSTGSDSSTEPGRSTGSDSSTEPGRSTGSDSSTEPGRSTDSDRSTEPPTPGLEPPADDVVVVTFDDGTADLADVAT